MMQGENEPSINVLVNNTSKQISQHHHQSTSVLTDRTIQRPKFSNKLKKPFWLTRDDQKLSFLLNFCWVEPLVILSISKVCRKKVVDSRTFGLLI